MPNYLIVKPCVYVDKAAGVAVQHNEGGAVCDIPDDVAKGLGDAVRPVPAPDLNPTLHPPAAAPAAARKPDVDAKDG